MPMKENVILWILWGLTTLALLLAAFFLAINTSLAQGYGPAANEGYCVGVAPEYCPYEWTFYEERWIYTSKPKL